MLGSYAKQFSKQNIRKYITQALQCKHKESYSNGTDKHLGSILQSQDKAKLGQNKHYHFFIVQN